MKPGCTHSPPLPLDYSGDVLLDPPSPRPAGYFQGCQPEQTFRMQVGTSHPSASNPWAASSQPEEPPSDLQGWQTAPTGPHPHSTANPPPQLRQMFPPPGAPFPARTPAGPSWPSPAKDITSPCFTTSTPCPRCPHSTRPARPLEAGSAQAEISSSFSRTAAPPAPRRGLSSRGLSPHRYLQDDECTEG